MGTVLAVTPALADRRGGQDALDLSGVVEAIGSSDFAEQLLSFLNHLVGADHCSIHQLRGSALAGVAAATLEGAEAMAKAEVTAFEVKRQLSMVANAAIRIDVSSVQDLSGARPAQITLQRRQNVLVCARRSDTAFCIRVIRSARRDPMTEAEIDGLRQVGNVLVSLVAKHTDLVANKPSLTPALCSLPDIEECVLAATDLSRREGEVCARILYGLSSCGIALDLGIGKESVMTYRKRAYQRLGIGSQRELLMWYLARWSAMHGEYGAAA